MLCTKHMQPPFLFGDVMKDNLSSKDNLNILRWDEAFNRAGKDLGLDPRLVALVRFLARRAAEADYAAEQAPTGRAGSRAPESEDQEC